MSQRSDGNDRWLEMIEYALLAALLSIVAIVVYIAIGPHVADWFHHIADLSTKSIISR